MLAVTGLGDSASWDANDHINGAKENVRIAAGAGVKALRGLKVDKIDIEDLGDAQSAAEGANLAAYKFQSYKMPDKRSADPEISLVKDSSADKSAWKRGVVVAKSQNWSRL